MWSMICLFILAFPAFIPARLISSPDDLTQEFMEMYDETQSEPCKTVGDTREDSFVGDTREDIDVDETREDTSVGDTIEDIDVDVTREDTSVGDTREDTSVGDTREDIDVGETREDTPVGDTREDTSVGDTREDIDVDETRRFDISDTRENKTMNQLITRVNDMKETITYLGSTVQKLLSEIQSMKKMHERVIFHAVLDTIIEYPLLNRYQRIIFETVMLNKGDGYQASNGKFTAPVAGMYIFSVSILSDNGPLTSFFEAEILKNGIVLAKLYGHGVNTYHDQASATVVTHLSISDHVWIRLICCGFDSLYGSRYSTFSGALLN
ncbi:heavy metal-binding protein HIP-like [Mercenaria mercenaria]|uniref:heavy metal-binding protein HIP-like n=1 Tax=Mercenaria mercenaria TaxID=6596 RepID=UPI001E1D45D0|nr:heavy metal-binding protein HIP-like [Mercenaria mercenaria]XP_045182802.1 heavy metal-binding protein HIP-like [Mercenaria mercenaria]XP_053382254.1 heavy metal-binding protein HIP-like [Mercenaria mercenaria]